MTPEGLNSRLTFLHQCTRQGPTLEKLGAVNLAFGRPPICILRIGDFYNTKVIIDNLTIDYEPLVWDLNPEGIGVQPMIANVNLSIKFIGGSSLLGPINKLQNALSFNYYANTHVYDPRADYIAKKTERATAENTQNTTTQNATQTADVLEEWEIVNGVSNVNIPKYRDVTITNTPVEPVTNQILASNDAEAKVPAANVVNELSVNNNTGLTGFTSSEVVRGLSINSASIEFDNDLEEFTIKWKKLIYRTIKFLVFSNLFSNSCVKCMFNRLVYLSNP